MDWVFLPRSPALVLLQGLLTPSRPTFSRTVALVSFVPAYSGVAVPDFHEVPLWAFDHLNTFYDPFFSIKSEALSNAFGELMDREGVTLGIVGSLGEILGPL